MKSTTTEKLNQFSDAAGNHHNVSLRRRLLQYVTFNSSSNNNNDSDDDNSNIDHVTDDTFKNAPRIVLGAKIRYRTDYFY